MVVDEDETVSAFEKLRTDIKNGWIEDKYKIISYTPQGLRRFLGENRGLGIALGDEIVQEMLTMLKSLFYV